MTSILATRHCANCHRFDIHRNHYSFRLQIPLDPDISNFLAETRRTPGCYTCTLLFTALQQVVLELPGPYRPTARGFIGLSGYYSPNKDPVGQPHIDFEIDEPSAHFQFFRSNRESDQRLSIPHIQLGPLLTQSIMCRLPLPAHSVTFSATWKRGPRHHIVGSKSVLGEVLFAHVYKISHKMQSVI
jgi:hypothetical protein